MCNHVIFPSLYNYVGVVMSGIALLLLWCFFGLMEVHSETAPYLNVSHNTICPTIAM